MPFEWTTSAFSLRTRTTALLAATTARGCCDALRTRALPTWQPWAEYNNGLCLSPGEPQGPRNRLLGTEVAHRPYNTAGRIQWVVLCVEPGKMTEQGGAGGNVVARREPEHWDRFASSFASVHDNIKQVVQGK